MKKLLDLGLKRELLPIDRGCHRGHPKKAAPSLRNGESHRCVLKADPRKRSNQHTSQMTRRKSKPAINLRFEHEDRQRSASVKDGKSVTNWHDGKRASGTTSRLAAAARLNRGAVQPGMKAVPGNTGRFGTRALFDLLLCPFKLACLFETSGGIEPEVGVDVVPEARLAADLGPLGLPDAEVRRALLDVDVWNARLFRPAEGPALVKLPKDFSGQSKVAYQGKMVGVMEQTVVENSIGDELSQNLGSIDENAVTPSPHGPARLLERGKAALGHAIKVNSLREMLFRRRGVAGPGQQAGEPKMCLGEPRLALDESLVECDRPRRPGRLGGASLKKPLPEFFAPRLFASPARVPNGSARNQPGCWAER